MPARQADPQRFARVVDLREDRFGQFRGGLPGRQQHRRQEPTRLPAHHRDVVGVDVDRVPADLIGGEGDRIGLGNQVAVAEIEHGGVFAGARPDDDARVVRREAGQQSFQKRQRQLAGRQKMRFSEHVPSDGVLREVSICHPRTTVNAVSRLRGFRV